ncbi:MAG TPA: ABC transporter substrate-binding protein [Syntrophales bacterium]|nr:ABC transporter substrate-binding protein [Syntrophales bacterium]
MMKTLRSALLVPLLMFLAGCSGSDSLTDLRIGLIAELTGEASAVGLSCRNAAELAVKEINDGGGLTIGDRTYKVKLLVMDNGGKADASAQAARKLIDSDKVVAIVGPNESRFAIPASDAAESAATVLISPSSTTPRTTLDARTGGPKKYVFRACYIDPFQGQVLAKFAYDERKAGTAAVLFDETKDYSRGIAEVFRDVFIRRGGKIVAYEPYTAGTRDFTDPLTRIRNAKPDVIFIPNHYTEVPGQIRQARKLGIQALFLGSDSWGTADLPAACGKDCDGCYFSTHYDAETATKEARTFVESYRKQYGSVPDDVAALTYDSFGLLRQALRTGGRLDRQAVRDALARIPRYEGVTGVMEFREGSGDPIKSAVIMKIQDGRFVWFANVNP